MSLPTTGSDEALALSAVLTKQGKLKELHCLYLMNSRDNGVIGLDKMAEKTVMARTNSKMNRAEVGTNMFTVSRTSIKPLMKEGGRPTAVQQYPENEEDEADFHTAFLLLQFSPSHISPTDWCKGEKEGAPGVGLLMPMSPPVANSQCSPCTPPTKELALLNCRLRLLTSMTEGGTSMLNLWEQTVPGRQCGPQLPHLRTR